jgi:predicted porin
MGPVHIGAGGHYGKGVGVTYAFDGSPTTSSAVSTPPNEMRLFSGLVAFGQLVAGQFDINVAVGQTQVKRHDADKNSPDSVLKTQTGISAGVVYHMDESLHFDVDFINTAFAWYGGEKQKVNFINAGITLTF